MNTNIKIEIKIKDVGNLLANANLEILTDGYGWVTIKDFQIWVSNNLNSRLNENINIQPLSINAHGNYLKKVFFEDSSQWEKIESEIFDAYKKKLLEEVPIDEKEVDKIFT